MIYTITCNPSLDYIVSVHNFTPGLTNRTRSEVLLPGGKGINVSTVLQNLGMESTALGFVAGFTGLELTRRLETAGIRNGFIPVKEGFTRINVKLRDIEGTEINGRGPVICPREAALLLDRLDGLQKGDVLFLCGSIPDSLPDDMYQQIMERLAGRKVQVIVDATKDLLLHTLPFHPFLIKPNHHELGELFGVSLDNRQTVIPYGKELLARGAQNVLISMAGKGAVLVAADGKVYEAPAPEGNLVNSVGAGDAMLAGFVAGYLERGEYGHAFRMGVAAGSASAFSEGFATRQEVEALYLLIHCQ